MHDAFGMACLDTHGVIAFVRGSYPAEARSSAEEHIDACSVCRMLVAEAAHASHTTIDPLASTDGGEGDLPRRVLQPGEVLGGRFHIRRLLGRGGMGLVFEAQDAELDTVVALKVLAPNVAAVPGIIRRMRREILLARRIVHPNVCRIYDIGRCGGMYFLTMEYVDGVDLAQALRERSRVPAEEARRWMTEMLGALAAIHDAGVVHRDLKPSNVMIDQSGRLLVMDFGLAGDVSEDATISAVRVGTPAWWSPEQARGLPATVRSDIFAFGLVAREIVGRMCGEDAVPYLPILARCLEREPDDRFGSAREIAVAFAATSHPRPVRAKAPPKASSRARFKTAAAFAFAAMASAAAGIALAPLVPIEEPAEPAARATVQPPARGAPLGAPHLADSPAAPLAGLRARKTAVELASAATVPAATIASQARGDDRPDAISSAMPSRPSRRRATSSPAHAPRRSPAETTAGTTERAPAGESLPFFE